MITALLSQLDIMIGDLILYPDQFDDRQAIALRKLAATQTAVERLLGAPVGSMPIKDEDALLSWVKE